MSSGLEDWMAWASGRIYSVATVEAAQALSPVERIRVRRTVGAGRLPAGDLERRYAAAFVVDRTRVTPRERDPISSLTLAAAFALVGIVAVARELWFSALSVFCGGLGLYLGAIIEPRRQRHRTAIARDALSVLSSSQRTTLEAGLRHPVTYSRRQKAAGAAAVGACILGSALTAILAINVAFPSDDGTPWATAAGLGVLLAFVWLFAAYVTAGKYWQAFDGEPWPPGTTTSPATNP